MTPSSLLGTRRPAPALLWAPALAAVGLTLLPLYYLLDRSTERGWAPWEDAIERLAGELVWDTARLAVAVMAGTVLVAVPAAWITARTDVPGRRLWQVGLSLPLAIPSYVYAIAVVSALGPKGILQSWLEPLGVDRLPDIYGFWGATATLTAVSYPYLYLVMHAAFATVDPAQEEASRSLGHGRWSTFLRVTLPPLRPAIAGGLLLIVLYAMSDFGAVQTLRFDTFTSVIYLQYQSSFDRTGAAVLALLLGALTLVVVTSEMAIRQLARGGSASGRRQPVRAPLGSWRWPAIAFLAAVTALAFVVPVGVLVYWWVEGIRAGVSFPDLAEPMRHSGALAASGAIVTVAAALPLAVLAARYGGWAARGLEQLSYLTHALPGLVVALAMVFFGIRYATSLYQTLWMVLAAYVVLFLPNALSTLRVPLLRQSPNLEDASASLGRRPLRTVLTVTLPLARPGVVAALMLVFLTALKELPATLLLAPPGYETLPGTIWGAANTGTYATAALPALILVAIAGVAVGALSWFDALGGKRG
ncbi:MAG: ABC transporter permease [Dehalococcoidia bacterium]